MDIILNTQPFFIGSNALASIDLLNEFDEANGLELDGDLLMSLLEELQGEETDNDDKLTNIMESLEFEISHPDDLNVDYTPVASASCRVDAKSQSGNCEERMDTQDLVVSEDLDFSWVDMEMSSPSTSNELNSQWYYMESYADEMMGVMNEFGNVTDYSQLCYGAPSDQDQIYSCSLWQDN